MLTTPKILYLCAKYTYLARHCQPQDPEFKKWADLWSADVFNALGIEVETHSEPLRENVILVGNHISYLDIPLLMGQVPARFLSKSIIKYWPVIGSTAKRGGTVFVNRSNKKSRNRAVTEIMNQINQSSQPVVIFPAGTTTHGTEAPWRPGAFRIAHMTKRPIQPFRLNYSPGRVAAYIDRDFFPVHLEGLNRAGPIKAHIEFGEPVFIDDPLEQTRQVQDWVNQGIWQVSN